ncbi:MAG: tRNA guanosine(34) transglycosylase Tgt [Planctomycetota bacterium]
MARDIAFELVRTDPSGARRARFRTAHGTVELPAFMPVGTQGAVKAVLPRDVAETGAEVVLANTYHLSLDERTDLVERAGGLHRFMCWERSILTDSGGFQVFSLPGREVSEDGVSFPGGKGKPRMMLDPEGSMEIQRRLGADIVMAFDECCAHDAPRAYVEASVERTARWARRCRHAPLAEHQLMFGIVQGGLHRDLRRRSAHQIRDLDFDGYAIGGVSVGEGHELMRSVVEWAAPELPTDRPRYLMGVGLPEDLLAAIERGMDMFDCVIPTRYARGGTLFTRRGRIRIGDKRHRNDPGPIEPRCACYACRNYGRMVLRHLHYAHEPVFETLASLHNLCFYQDLMREARHELERGRFAAWKAAWLRRYGVPDSAPAGDPGPGAGPTGT